MIVRYTSLAFLAAVSFVIVSIITSSALSQTAVRLMLVGFALATPYIHRAVKRFAYATIATYMGKLDEGFSVETAQKIVFAQSILASVALVVGTLLGLA